MRKTSRKAIVRKLDKLVSEIIRSRYKSCVICGSKENANNGHIFSRRNHSLRWDVRKDGNCHRQCYPCNFLHSARDPYPYYNWYIKKFGQKKFDKLHKDWAKVTRRTTPQLIELYEDIKKNNKVVI